MKIGNFVKASLFVMSGILFSCSSKREGGNEEIVNEVAIPEMEKTILPEKVISTKVKLPELMVCLDNIKDDGTHFIISIYRQQDLFLKRTSHHKELDIVFESSQKCTMIELDYGRYAIAVFNDVNSNNILDINGIGLPTESYGFSVLKGTILKVPIYKDCQFEFTPSAARCVIDMRHTR